MLKRGSTVIKLLFLTGDSEHEPEIKSTSHESELEDDENDLLFSASEEEFEEDVAGSISGLLKRLTFKFISFQYRTIVFFEILYV